MTKHKQNSNKAIIILSIISAILLAATIVFVILFVQARGEIDCLEKDIEELQGEAVVDDDIIMDDDDPDFPVVVKKPLIYLYPTEDMEVSVKLGSADKLLTSYPKYNDGWSVLAKKDGSLVADGRNYYGLYWEGANYPAEQTDEGFVVAGKDSAKFLEEKLAQLGLSEREANEMIIYWLPQLEANVYNYIRFDTNEVMDKYMPLNISPKPDSVIRISMIFRGLDKPIAVREQKLPAFERSGFTVVEWGGSEIKNTASLK